MNKIRLFLIGVLGIFLLISNCHLNDENKPSSTRGKQLADIYCSTCHLVPAPDLLNSATWKDVILPRMGYMLGFYPNEQARLQLFEQGEAGQKVREASIYPPTPQIGAEIWADIQYYYETQSPKALPRPKMDSTIHKMTEWNARVLAQPGKAPGNTLVQLNERGLSVGDAQSGQLFQYDQELQLISTARSKEGAVHLHEKQDAYWITVMGSFSPTDAASGFIFRLPKSNQEKAQVIIRDLQRPVHASYVDIDQDGLEDIVVSEYGKWTGQLSLFLQQSNGSYEKLILRKVSGAIRSEVIDINQDGRLDVMALFGQGDEGIWSFEQQPDGTFKEKSMLRFPATYGSSYFKLQDLDGDNDLDLLYTCGDNADYNPVLKPYHGIYFFENNGQFQFSQSFFYPMDGACKVIASDFDQDDDLDLAAVSFFPDFNDHPERAFLLLTNDTGTYIPHMFPEVELSRWMVMDSGDYDADGDLDLALGALLMEVPSKPDLINQWGRNGVGAIILGNAYHPN